MKLIRYILAFITILLFTNQVQAASFEEYVQRLKQHPQVNSILAESNKFKEMAKGEMSLPNPQFILGLDNVSTGNSMPDSSMPESRMIGFSQQIPNYSFRKANSEKQEVMSAKQDLLAEYTVKRLKAYLIIALTELDKVKQLEEYAKEQLTYYVDLENHLKGQLEAGNSVYGRLSEIDVDRIEVEQNLNDLKAERDNIEAELINLVGEVPNVPLPDIPNIQWNKDIELVYPVKIAKEDISLSEKGINAADSAFYPDYGVQALYKQSETGKEADVFSMEAAISIPLWYNWNQKPKLRAAKADKQAADLSYNDTKRMWQKKLTALISERDIALKNTSLLYEKKKAISEITAAAKRKYEASKTDLESVLNAKIDELTVSSKLASQHSRHIQLAAEFNSYLIGNK